MHSFGYVAYESLEETLEYLADSGSGAKVLAGGTCLIPQIRWQEAKPGCKEFRLFQPDALVSLKNLRELSCFADKGEFWRLGAMTRLRSLGEGEVRERLPLLGVVASGMASPEVRNRGTVGGNLCNASPAADLLAPLLALGARVTLLSAQAERTERLADFYRGAHRTTLMDREVLAWIDVPKDGSDQPFGYARYSTRPTMGTTLVSAVCVLSDPEEEARLVLSLASGKPIVTTLPLAEGLSGARTELRGLLQGALDKQASRVAACHFQRENDTPGWYLAHRAQLCAEEALGQAWARARNGCARAQGTGEANR